MLSVSCLGEEMAGLTRLKPIAASLYESYKTEFNNRL